MSASVQADKLCQRFVAIKVVKPASTTVLGDSAQTPDAAARPSEHRQALDAGTTEGCRIWSVDFVGPACRQCCDSAALDGGAAQLFRTIAPRSAMRSESGRPRDLKPAMPGDGPASRNSGLRHRRLLARSPRRRSADAIRAPSDDTRMYQPGAGQGGPITTASGITRWVSLYRLLTGHPRTCQKSFRARLRRAL
jgi:hypothetical protein